MLGHYPHAFWFEPSRGERDALAVRALVLESSGRRVAWVSLDLLAVEARFTAEVAERLRAAGARPLTLILSASHTHSGPGAYIDSAVLGWLALDRLDRDVREALVTATVAAIREADAARRPARLATASVTVPGVARSRLGQPLDEAMLVLRVTGAGGEPIALVWNFAIHGTTLGARNLRLSGDVMGEASTRLERALGVPALFVNGAVGDVSPARHGEGATTAVGAALATAAQEGWAAAVPIERMTLSVGATTVALPGPSLSIHNCLGGWWPRALSLPLGGVFPRETTLGAVAIGELGWVTFPGELQTALGLGIKRAAGLQPRPGGRPLERLSGLLPRRRRLRAPDLRELWQCLRPADGGVPGRGGGRVTARGGSRRGVERRPSRLRPGCRRSMRRLVRDQPARQLGLLAGGGVAVDDALGHRLVEEADRLLDDRALLGALDGARDLEGRADLRADRAVTHPAALVLTDPLDGRLRVCHSVTPPRAGCAIARDRAGRAPDRRASCPTDGGFSR